jgi:anthranilate phosphoribosyltransferase
MSMLYQHRLHLSVIANLVQVLMTQKNFSAAEAEMRSYIQRVATGPELSKNLERAEAAGGMRLILENRADPVQAAIFLIGLRMKRETDDENAGVLDALLDSVRSQAVALDDLVDIADPYDGFVRGTPASSFLPAVLAALDIPAILTGARAVGPKYGVTHHMILQCAGIDVLAEPLQVKTALENPDIGWSYLDQLRFIPHLHDLLDLRTLMVKRSVLTTLEVLLRPIRARRTHLMTGYVHKPYPPRYVRLAGQAGYSSAMVVRGVEGGVVPSLSQPSRYVRYDNNEPYQEVRLDPVEFAIEQSIRIEALPENAEHTEPDGQPFASINAETVAVYAAKKGIAALQGESGAFRDSLIYAAGICLSHLGRFDDFTKAANAVRRVLDDGSAWQRFERLMVNK